MVIKPMEFKPITLAGQTLKGQVFLAPMAGITDVAFRSMCLQWGAAYAVGEMVASQPHLWTTQKSQTRFQFAQNESLKVVQLLGADPDQLEKAIFYAQEQGAQVVDFNMGCPAKKVCSVACGSALMKEPKVAQTLLQRFAQAARQAGVTPTLKCRTGWDAQHRNVLDIAKMAQDNGFAMLTVHGRTRQDAYLGHAEYDTIAQVVQSVSIPVVANGDITDTQKAQNVLKHTQAAAVMIGRAAIGAPWLFAQIDASLKGRPVSEPEDRVKAQAILTHARYHYALYEPLTALRTFRKHLAMYLRAWPQAQVVLPQLMQESTSVGQLQCLVKFFASQGWL